jgi:hypothetical protein
MVRGGAASDDVDMKHFSPRIGQVDGALAFRASRRDTRAVKAHFRRGRGQVVVETAIVMPMFVFLILGLLQLGLMHHARVMTKYAAYKAVRAGSLQRGEKDKMTKAALAVLLPVLGRNSASGAPYKTGNVGDYNTAWNAMKDNKQDDVEFVHVEICNPGKNQIGQNADFDDPRTLGQGSGGSTPPSGEDGDSPDPDATPSIPSINPAVGPAPSFDWKAFNATKLQIQVTTYYRMYIPFANWMLWRLAIGEEQGSPKQMRWLGWGVDPNKPQAVTLKKLKNMANAKKYVMPIRASYAMRMQSNFSQAGRNNLPGGGGNGTPGDCKISWPKK